MAYITESMLKGYAADNLMFAKASVNIKKEALAGIKTIFLSHSHLDEVFKNRIQLYEASSHQAKDVKEWLMS